MSHAGLPNFADLRFLIVDDFHGMRSMLRDMLRDAEAKHIDTAMHGTEAIGLLRNHKYDVVLCDFNLGDGKNGQQLLEEAKITHLIGPACAWIMITAEKTTEAVMGAVEYQPDGYLLKPITAAQLQTRLEKIWVKKRAFQEIDRALSAKDYLAAIHQCDQRIAIDKVNASELMRLKSQLLLTIGDTDRARALYEQVLAQRDLPWARTGLAKVHFQAGEYDQAAGLLRQVIDENRAYLEAYDWLARTLQKQGDVQEAAQVLERAAKLSPNSPERQKNLGELALLRGDVEAAEKAFRKSMVVGEHSVLKTPDAYLGYARVCSKKQQPGDAVKALGVLQKHFDSDEVRLRAKATEGMVYRDNHDEAKARQVAQEVVTLLENSEGKASGKAGLEAAELLLATGNKDAAVSLLQSVVRNNHDDQDLVGKVQQAFDSAGMAEEGARLVASSRKEAVDMMNTGVLLAREGKLGEAVEWMRNARAAMPSNVRVLFNFAHVALMSLQKQGHDEALVREVRLALSQANKLAPGDKRHAQLSSQLASLG
ncbi:tetratricopeptide repeat protein [Chitinivorax sp. PXF-14]|uniref:tetratricopeptide repeat protein n=1 Tax=Chitinivorax sp. PXF-14 TaxID=3230488 RepID=UPI003467380A